jgi:hypothetical protein
MSETNTPATPRQYRITAAFMRKRAKTAYDTAMRRSFEYLAWKYERLAKLAQQKEAVVS